LRGILKEPLHVEHQVIQQDLVLEAQMTQLEMLETPLEQEVLLAILQLEVLQLEVLVLPEAQVAQNQPRLEER